MKKKNKDVINLGSNGIFFISLSPLKLYYKNDQRIRFKMKTCSLKQLAVLDINTCTAHA